MQSQDLLTLKEGVHRLFGGPPSAIVYGCSVSFFSFVTHSSVWSQVIAVRQLLAGVLIPARRRRLCRCLAGMVPVVFTIVFLVFLFLSANIAIFLFSRCPLSSSVCPLGKKKVSTSWEVDTFCVSAYLEMSVSPQVPQRFVVRQSLGGNAVVVCAK